MPIKVCIIEDNKSVRDSLSDLIKVSNDLELSKTLTNANSINNDVNTLDCDVVLMDIQMPGISGIEALKVIKATRPEIKVIMQTVFEDEDKIFEAICAGASGYILKKTPPQKYIEAIVDAYHGGAPISGTIAAKVLKMFRFYSDTNGVKEYNLSEREKEVLSCLVKGLSYKMIADKCSITYDTVRFHMKNIYSKLHVTSMTEAVAKALKEKIV